MGPLAVRPGFILTACIGFLESILFAQSRYSGEGLGPSSKQCALPSLRSEWDEVGGKVEGVGTGIGM